MERGEERVVQRSPKLPFKGPVIKGSHIIRPGAWEDALLSEVTEGGEIIEVCTVELKGLEKLLDSRGHEVRKKHEEVAERKKSVGGPGVRRFNRRIEERPAESVGLAVEGDGQELRKKPPNGRNRHVETMFHSKWWEFEGFRQRVFTREEREANLKECVICGC